MNIADKWYPNLINVCKYDKVGKCPFCGSENTDFGFVKSVSGKTGWGDLWCNDCKRAFHISRVGWEGNVCLHEKQPPEGLKFV